ncbi:peptide-methionine (S)-S-oxide reductase MsrA [Vitreoscilla massiliensis]|uniref:Peptide methionine sulfoxide reductase MsrA n=1 Tax=Vitreoscilla massiliensis TaxID=1689272 RepID=A0ABY4DYQ0_9NEIS|nr:peptide-methionine (S)-S-oxide reductase MsrA [Vitreoscilla massiliensis]UOO88658.1 peptide-methionine (S)-S-oxide reductase MsrA [Vitreoscilla massiliensis]
MQTAIVAGGCFWCLEAVFTSLQGVHAVKSGYTAGHTENPTYAQVCTGNTGHTEAVKIDFDENTISYAQLLDIFFATHNPTTLNRQGNDVGTQYRSGIYYLNAAQHAEAEAAIAATQAEHAAPIVTELQAASTFYPAESEHDDYFRLHPYQGYCQLVIAPKVLHAREEFAALWRQD